jgi:ATP-dependent helicase Lhr and Lhr-like helicase
MSSASLFHPAVAAWFDRTFAAPTAAQAQAWPAIRKGRHVLIAAPTGSGKTLAAFMAAIDALVRQGVKGERLIPEEGTIGFIQAPFISEVMGTCVLGAESCGRPLRAAHR